MKKFVQEKLWKRILSVAMVFAMVFALLPWDSLSLIAEAGTVSDDKGVYDYLYNLNSTTARRVRAVLKDFPDTGTLSRDQWIKNVWKKGVRGSVDRPFMLLEVVPYYNNSTLGYFVDGCEPVKIDDVTGDMVMVTKLLPNLGDLFEYKAIEGELYYFADEAEGHSTFYIDQNVDNWDTDPVTKLMFNVDQWNSKKRTGDSNPRTLKGYYEVVKAGDGDFVLNVVDGKKYIVDATNDVSLKANATLKWHTANQFLIDEWQAQGIDTNNLFKALSNLVDHPDLIDLTTLGSRFYTVREAKEATDIYYDVSKATNYGQPCLYRVKNKDRFVTDTIGLSEAGARDYSVWIKTVTPVELNENPEWVDMADLIYMNRFSDQTEILNYWGMKINGVPVNTLEINGLTNAQARQEKDYKGTYSNIYPSNYVGKPKDLTWTVTEKIVKRVASSDDYVGIVFDKAIANQLDQKTPSPQYRYNLNDERMSKYNSGVNTGEPDTSSQGNSNGFISNIGKLYVMCGACNPNIVKKFFIDRNKIEVFATSDEANGVYAGYTSYIKNRETGVNGEDRIWNAQTFYVGSDLFPEINMGDVSQSEYWSNYAGHFSIVGENKYVQGHNYISGSNSNNTLLSEFHNGSVDADPAWYVNFNNYLQTNEKTKEIWIRNRVEALVATGMSNAAATAQAQAEYANVNSSNVAPWAALRYILDLDNDVNFYYGGNIYILDVEPSVGLSADNAKPNWTFTEEIAELMLPNFTGNSMNIIIEHNIMNAFVGKIKDINSEYDMIYLGEDPGGFWLDDTANPGRTNFADNSMDGLVYFHMGDLIKVGRPADASFSPGSDGTVSRQPGNDITRKKAQELVDYLQADYAIAVSDNLFKTGKAGESAAGEKLYVENSDYCVLKDFLDNNRATKDATTGLYSKGVLKQKAEVGAIDSKVRNKKINDFAIVSTPRIYKYSDTAAVRDATYLDLDGSKNANMPFRIELPQASGYSYKIYIDKDRNAKFEEKPGDALLNEVVRKGTIDSAVYDASKGKYYFDTSTKMSAEAWTGFIQWKIEVYRTDNPNIRTSKQGCSAIPVPAGVEKNQIRALFVTPNKDSNEDMKTQNRDGSANSSVYTALYEKVQDFDVTVIEVSWAEFESLFYEESVDSPTKTSYGFYYNVGDKTINEDALDKIENIAADDTDPVRQAKLEMLGGISLSKFNMLIFGFKDSYGNIDMKNEFGAAEYIYYFARKGDTSILFTHDNTSFFNNPDKNDQGYTACTILREIQGMNRYGVVGTNASTGKKFIREEFGSQLQAYVDSQGDIYDNIAAADKKYSQSFTLYTLLCKIGDGVTAATSDDTRSQYKYVVYDPEVGAITRQVYNGDGTDLNGEKFYLSVTRDSKTHYFTNTLEGGTSSRITREKNGNMSNFAVYSFETVSGNEYYIYTMIGSQKNYIYNTGKNGSDGWIGFTTDRSAASVFKVAKHPSGEYLITLRDGGGSFGLNMYQGTNGSGFALYNHTTDVGSMVTLEFVEATTLPSRTIIVGGDISPNGNGFASNKNALSDYAKRTNEGQITNYPFEIGQNLITAPTHGQYYQLNMEDPELTVWYTLEDPKPMTGVDINGKTVKKTERNLNGSAGFGLMYGVTPENVSENYYIFSKGNIYYSGIGHSATGTDNEYERKLFVNVLIGAYRPKVMPPEVELTVVDKTKVSGVEKSYQMMIEREYDFDGGEGLTDGSTFDEDVCVTFIPRDYSGCSTVRCQVYYTSLGEDASDKYFTIHEVINDGVEKKVGNPVAHMSAPEGASDEEKAISNTTYVLSVDREYCIAYNKKYISDPARTKITFAAQNDVIEEKGITRLEMKPLPLFRLD